MTFYFYFLLLLVGTDYFTKLLVKTHILMGETVPVIEGFLHFTYVENTGAAFGFLSDNSFFLGLFSIFIMIGLLLYIALRKPDHPLYAIGLMLIIAGGIGNAIDRLFYNYVVDFIDFIIIKFAVFNLADVYVVIGTIFVAIYLMFFDSKKNENNS